MNLSIFSKTKNSFEGQLPDEKTITVVRMHWFVLITAFIIFSFMVVVLALSIFLAEYVPGDLRTLIWFFISILFLYWWYWLFYTGTMYYLNVWIITNHRVIASRQKGLFKRELVELSIANIQDISVNIEGFMNTFLNFGEVEVQSAGAEKKFRMTAVPSPMDVKNSIIKAQNEFVHIHPDKISELLK